MVSNSSCWMVDESLKSTIWTPVENKLFENSLAKFDKDGPDWWQKVAEMIPGKTVADGIQQYKELEDDVSSIEAGFYPKYGSNNNTCSFTLERGNYHGQENVGHSDVTKSVVQGESKIGQMAPSQSSSATEVEETTKEKNHVKGTGDDRVVVENQSNTQDAKDSKRKGKKNKKNKGTSTSAVSLADKNLCAVKDATILHDASLSNDDLKLLSFVFGSSQENVGHSDVTMSVVQGESKIGQMVPTQCSRETEVEETSEEKNHVKGTGNDPMTPVDFAFLVKFVEKTLCTASVPSVAIIVEGDHLGKKKVAAATQHHNHGFEHMVFSWSLDDILNQDLYKHQVEDIPLTFHSEEHYFGSFVYPLLEETRAELASTMEIMYRAPYAEIISLEKVKGDGKMLYDVTVGNWRNKTSERGKEPYRTLPGDLLILADGIPESVPGLQRVGRMWAFSLVNKIRDHDDEDDSDSTSVSFKVKSSQEIEFQEGMFVVFLMNITTNKRIWSSLHMHRNINIIKELLYTDSMVKESCNICPFDINFSQKFDPHLMDQLNESQAGAIRAALSKTECCHGSFVEQIWGPPGTGKTTTVSVLLFILLQMNRRTLTCAPTNVAIVQVASRVLNLVKKSSNTTTATGDVFYCIGDVLLFGNKQRLKVGAEIEEIYLENRVKMLTMCLGSLTGWRHCIKCMVDLLENCVSNYHVFVENELFKEKELASEDRNEAKVTKLEVKSFIEFVRDRFSSCVLPLRRCILTFLTHVPKSFMMEHNFQKMASLLDDLSVFKSLLFEENLLSEELEQLFTSKPLQNDYYDNMGDAPSINFVRAKSISLLKALQISLEGLGLPHVLDRFAIMDFCFQNASLIFCTTSTSYKLHNVKMKPVEILVIDEAAQLKEAESTIPLQLPGMKHAILIGDECQLPAMVSSNLCIESGFGRSLFGRLSSLGHSKHLLNVQYRMHPSISLFPNYKFYQNQILDAENVTCKRYENRYLSGPMFGSYSFINVVGGREEKDEDERSRRNMVEVAIVIKIVQNLYKAWQDSRKKLTIGVVSPYAAQVVSIQEKLASKYDKLDGFSVKVKSIDGFQGGEEDIIILSTVRSNNYGAVGFLSSPERTNVALTRARHCLWILGNERTLSNSESVWKELVCDARNRHCLFDADADECLKTSIIDTKKELDQLDDLVNGNSVLFKHEKWKVLFSDDFKRSFGKLTSTRLKKLVLNLLLKLCAGWRPKNISVDVCCESFSQILKKFKVGTLYIICSVDIIKEVKYIQVLKVWDILPLEEITKLTKRLEGIFSAYTDDYINRCTSKRLEGNLEVPRSWPASEEIIRFRSLSNSEGDSEASVIHGDGRIYVENSKVSESLLLMKFYSLSRGVVSHLLSGKELDLPMQVTDEQMDIILFSKSSFIIGRSGTGKTTILTSKLFQNEHNFRVACEGINEAESSQVRDVKVDDSKSSKPSVLRQLFVTVSPKLCYAVKQHVSQLTSISCDGNPSAEIKLEDVDSTSEFNDIPDTFVEIPTKKYPLVLTFQKFLMMLDGTLGSSYFERFSEARKASHGIHISSGSVALQTFIRLKEVTFDRFSSLYWPHFNSTHKKRLDPSRVFTEIISHIKGGLLAGDCTDGKLSFEGYSSLAESRVSTLTKQKRENIYSLFQAYENMKTQRGEFDMGDLVIDLHHRLKNIRYKGDQMDFIYIDEVQDLSMRQISLLKYICQNVDEGFIFAGDTAQTIARGIDFRFQDIRTVFYKEFLASKTAGKQEKGIVSEIFQLKQNFRTHAGVLDLAQSVIDILYCYFSHSIDILEPETSLISGEAPVLLESGNDENAIVTIFGGSGSGAEIVGFGAEQVILVRDDIAKTEICECIGKQALVLTIVECKGLEFQDVLLYNFFGTSPLKDQWRVIYGYMKDRDWLEEKLILSFPSFSESRHSVLCSELKQLYVAITRTRQRLWICENKEELSKPMFDYWKRRGLVQVRKLDDSVAQAMRVASSTEEWRERGKKLFYENNFVMATMCFERAGDIMWETLARASGLRASADQMRGTNPEAFIGYVREAAGMFESIGKLEIAAACYCDLGEYERAGKIYMLKCGKMDAAAECFTLAGCYSDASEAYAKGDQLSKCLSVCRKGKLFDKGLQYIEQWKDHLNVQTEEIELIEQEFLESCALDYHEHKDSKSMMKFVRAFCSMASKRAFLRSLGCLDDLLILEEESGHFLDAAELARSQGDVLKEADLLEKAGHSKEATLLLLWYVFFSSLWGDGNKGWPLKHFAQKEELCEKTKFLAMVHSDNLYEFVCGELKSLSDQHSSLLELKRYLCVSRNNKSLRGEILLVRKILDFHIGLNSSKFDWEDELPVDITKHCEDKTFQNHISVRTLVFYWNRWKEYVLDIFESLESFHKEEPSEHKGHVDFILNYFGVRKHCVKGNSVYTLVNEHADWIRNISKKGLHRDDKLLTINIKDLVFSIRSYWQSELVSVGIKVLETLEGLHKSKSDGSAFHQSTSLLHIFEVSKFLLDCQFVMPKDSRKLERFLGISSTYFDLVFPLDWRRSISEDLISLRETDLSINLLEEIIQQNLNIKGDITYYTIGKVMMICLGSRKPVALYEHIITRIQWNPAWKLFFEIFMIGGLQHAYIVQALHNALEDTFRVDWRHAGYISPHSFVYLLESLLFMASFSSRIFFTTKSSFVEWFTHIHSTTYPAPKQIVPVQAIHFIVGVIQQILYETNDTLSWIEGSNICFSSYRPLLSQKLVMILCLICLQAPDFSQVLLDLLSGRNNIAYLLPKKFASDLLRKRKGRDLNLMPDVVAEAFMSIDDSLMIVCSGNASPRVHAPSAIFVDLGKSKEEILSILFPRKDILCVEKPSNNDDIETILEAPSSNMLPNENLIVNLVELQMNWKVLEDISEAINGNEGVALNSLSAAAMIKKELDKNIGTLATALADKNLCASKDATVVHDASFANDDLKLLSSAFGTRLDLHSCKLCNKNVKHSVGVTSVVQGVVERLQSIKPKIDDFLNPSVMSQESTIRKMKAAESSSATEVEETGDDPGVVENQSNTRDAKNKKGKGKKKNKGKVMSFVFEYLSVWAVLFSRLGDCGGSQPFSSRRWTMSDLNVEEYMEFGGVSSLISSFLEIAPGQTYDTARQFLQATGWKLEEAIQLFYVENEFGDTSSSSPYIPSLDNEMISMRNKFLGVAENHMGFENIVGNDGSEIRAPLPVRRDVLYDPQTCYSSDEELRSSDVWGADEGSTSAAETSRDNLASLYSPPFALMYHGPFQMAKEAASGQNRWLLVNVQSTMEFSSHMLNRDTWGNETVAQAINNYFIFWQVCDDTEEGRKIVTYYKLDTIPVTLVLDPITGQKMRLWRGMIEPETLLEDVLEFTDNSPQDHHFSLSHKRSRESGHVSAPKIEGSMSAVETNEDEEEMKVAKALSMATIEESEEFSKDSTKECPKKEKHNYLALPEEPKGDKSLLCRVGIRFPDGSRVQRNFLRSDPIQLLWSFCAAKCGDEKRFRLTHAIPGAVKDMDYESLLSFEDSGVANSLISVTWE
ncbi:hypothetical protein SSX86_017705 [Deinandra increscens subsp. villosa]|uniref:Uncharacterized protein n=1 Tax=Deinandra increscens subsp. villosa TaxID=3103831 RepID=A0AAP0D311_9ASTR